MTADTRDALAQWSPRRELLEFACALDASGSFGGGDEHQHLLRFFEKPWYWAAEYDVWVAAGKPGGPDDAGWDGFLEGLDAL